MRTRGRDQKSAYVLHTQWMLPNHLQRLHMLPNATMFLFQTLLHQTVETCGSNLSAQHEFHSLGEQVRVAFSSDAQNAGRGFKLEYKIASE